MSINYLFKQVINGQMSNYILKPLFTQFTIRPFATLRLMYEVRMITIITRVVHWSGWISFSIDPSHDSIG